MGHLCGLCAALADHSLAMLYDEVREAGRRQVAARAPVGIVTAARVRPAVFRKSRLFKSVVLFVRIGLVLFDLDYEHLELLSFGGLGRAGVAQAIASTME